MVLDFWCVLIVICVTHPPVSLSHTGPLLILLVPLQTGTPEWNKPAEGDSGWRKRRGIRGLSWTWPILKEPPSSCTIAQIITFNLLPFKDPLSSPGDSWWVGRWIWVSLKTKDQEQRLVGVQEHEKIHAGIKQQASLQPYTSAGRRSRSTEWTWIGKACDHIYYTNLIKVCGFCKFSAV